MAQPDDRYGNPTSIPLVSFAAFCSNPLHCLLLSIVRSDPGGAAISTPIGRHTGIGRCIWLHHLNLEHDDKDDSRTGERRWPNRMTVTETQPQSPLFPLLPSVQILFTAFC